MRRSSASSSKVNIAGAASGAKRLRARGGLLSSAASIKIAGQDHYLDLLFYQPSLRCFAVIELKIEDFKLESAGSMNFILCRRRPATTQRRSAHHRHYSLQGPQRCDCRICFERLDQTPMSVAQYRVAFQAPGALSAACRALSVDGLKDRRVKVGTAVHEKVSFLLDAQLCPSSPTRPCAHQSSIRWAHRTIRLDWVASLSRRPVDRQPS